MGLSRKSLPFFLILISLHLPGCIHRGPTLKKFVPQEGEYIGRGIGKNLESARRLAILDAKTQIAEEILSQIEIESKIEYTNKNIIVKKIITEYSNYTAFNMKRLKEEWEKLPDGRWAYYILYLVPNESLIWARKQILDDQNEIIEKLKICQKEMVNLGNNDEWDKLRDKYLEIQKLSENIFLPKGKFLIRKTQVLFGRYLQKLAKMTLTKMKVSIGKKDFKSAENSYFFFWSIFNSLKEDERQNWLKNNSIFIDKLISQFLDSELDEMTSFSNTNNWSALFDRYSNLKEVCDTLSFINSTSWIEKANLTLKAYLSSINLDIKMGKSGGWNLYIKTSRDNAPLCQIPIHVWSKGISPKLDLEAFTDSSGNIVIQLPKKITIDSEGIILAQISLNNPLSFVFDTAKYPIPLGEISVRTFIPNYDYSQEFTFYPIFKAIRIRLSIRNLGETPVELYEIIVYLDYTPIAHITHSIWVDSNSTEDITIDIVDYDAYHFKILRKIPPFPDPETKWYFLEKYALSKLIRYDQNFINLSIVVNGDSGDNFFITKREQTTLGLR